MSTELDLLDFGFDKIYRVAQAHPETSPRQISPSRQKFSFLAGIDRSLDGWISFNEILSSLLYVSTLHRGGRKEGAGIDTIPQIR